MRSIIRSLVQRALKGAFKRSCIRSLHEGARPFIVAPRWLFHGSTKPAQNTGMSKRQENRGIQNATPAKSQIACHGYEP